MEHGQATDPTQRRNQIPRPRWFLDSERDQIPRTGAPRAPMGLLQERHVNPPNHPLTNPRFYWMMHGDAWVVPYSEDKMGNQPKGYISWDDVNQPLPFRHKIFSIATRPKRVPSNYDSFRSFPSHSLLRGRSLGWGCQAQGWKFWR